MTGALAIAIYARGPGARAEAARLADTVRARTCVLDEFIDSGDDARQPGAALQRLLGQAEAYDAVVVTSLAAFGVQLPEIQAVYRKLAAANVRVIVAGTRADAGVAPEAR